jgi:hypothetical protein
MLLAQLRADATMGTAAAGSNWCVVPPINLGLFGQREAVAVFYNATNLQFTGPNLLYQLYAPNVGQSQPVNAVTHAAITNYSAGWQAALPVALARTTNFVIGGVATPIPERRLAGEWQYYTAPPARPVPSPPPPVIPANRIQFPYQGCRGPFLTRFREVMAPNRTLNLFSVHTSPSSARQAVINMGNVPQMLAVAANEVNVILGDFNVDTFAGNWGAYNWMLPLYRCELDPRANHMGPVVQARKPYCMTHLLPTNTATPFNNNGVVTDPQHNVYPRYGYMGSSWPDINNSGAIDNIFAAYGAGAGGPAANITVINTLTGTPYNWLAAAPAGVTAELTGGLHYATTIALANHPLITTPPAAAGTGGIDPLGVHAGQLVIFQLWNNFGKVNSTSDHLPLLVDI